MIAVMHLCSLSEILSHIETLRIDKLFITKELLCNSRICTVQAFCAEARKNLTNVAAALT